MSRKIFISYEFAWKNEVRTIKGWFQPGGACDGDPRFVYDPDAQTTEKIDSAILGEMRDCKIALFVKSANVHNKTWIDREAELATSLNLPIVVVPLMGSPAGLPDRLKDRNDIIIVDEWSSRALCPVLNAIEVRKST